MILANYMIVVIFQLHCRRHVFVIAVANAIDIIMVLTSTSSPGVGIAFLQQHAHAVGGTARTSEDSLARSVGRRRAAKGV